jgi:hypothetical protein
MQCRPHLAVCRPAFEFLLQTLSLNIVNFEEAASIFVVFASFWEQVK